jgi:hypothetical protein
VHAALQHQPSAAWSMRVRSVVAPKIRVLLV